MEDLGFCKIRILDDIVILDYRNQEINLEDCKVFYAWCQKNIPEQKFKFLNIIPSFSSFTEEAKRFSANEGCHFSLAEAFVVQNSIMKVLGNFYIRIDKPNVSTKIFSNVADAMNWLKQVKAPR
jgi:hypothetical protein